MCVSTFLVCAQILVRLIQLGRGKDYLPSLVSMEMSLHSMEVINRLSMAASLPAEFVHLYISNCIRSCQAAQVDLLLPPQIPLTSPQNSWFVLAWFIKS
jgi:hypothetical protein